MKTNTTTKTAIAIATVEANNVNLVQLGAVLRDYVTADKGEVTAHKKADDAKAALETAKVLRARQVTAFADTCVTFGWTDLAPIKKGGAYRAELAGMAAACILSKAALAAFQSSQAPYTKDASGKRIYSAKHNAGLIVQNYLNRLITAAEKAMNADPIDTAKEAAAKGANANKAKDLATFLNDWFADGIKRVGNDARKEAPTGANHGKIKAILEAALKEVKPLLK